MNFLARIRPYLRLAAFVAALCALMAPATAGASVHAHAAAKKKKAKPPVVTAVRPMTVEIGQTLEIHGKYFVRGRNRNSVVFKRDGGKAVFVKAKVGTTKLLRVTVPEKLEKEMRKQGTQSLPTRFRVRVLAEKFGKKFTPTFRSPVISVPPPPLPPGTPGAVTFSPAAADGDCNNDGIPNGKTADDDGDLLPDTLELQIGTDPCNADTDGDGVEDGYEYQSARDLNDDEYQSPNAYQPYPGPRPYPNPLFADAGVDYDGDSLTLGEEYNLWKYVGNRTLSPLSYSDGEQYSIGKRAADGHRQPTLVAATYDKRSNFVAWASSAGYRQVSLQDGNPWYDGSQRNLYNLFDVNRDGTESTSELYYNDVDGDGYLSDDERDEDADGLTNYDETHGRLNETYWSSCYQIEKPYYIGYKGTSPTNADTDGDGIRDGADDQDHDDIPNLMELSRFAASGYFDGDGTCKPRADLPKPPDTNHPDAYGRVNPFNPCLPYTGSRTCAKYVNGDTGAPFDGSPNWYSLN